MSTIRRMAVAFRAAGLSIPEEHLTDFTIFPIMTPVKPESSKKDIKNLWIGSKLHNAGPTGN